MKIKGTNKNGRTFASTAATNSRAKWRSCAEGCANGYGSGMMTLMFGMINFPSRGIMLVRCWAILALCETYLNYRQSTKQQDKTT